MSKFRFLLAFFFLLQFSFYTLSQSSYRPSSSELNNWKVGINSYLQEMKAVEGEMQQKRDNYMRQQTIDMVNMKLEQNDLLKKLNEMDSRTRQAVLEDLLGKLNYYYRGDNRLKFTGGTVPGNQKFRDGFGDYDLEAKPETANNVKDLLQQLLPPGTEITDTKDYIAIDDLRFTIFKRKPVKDIDDLISDRDELLEAARDKEVYLFLRLPPPSPPSPGEKLYTSIYRDFVKALEIQGHMTKGVKGAKVEANQLFTDPELIQTFAKSAAKSIKAAGLTDEEIKNCLQAAGNSRTLNQFNYQLDNLPKSSYLNPFLAGLTPDNIREFQLTVKEILLLAGKKSREKMNKAVSNLAALGEVPENNEEMIKNMMAAGYLYEMQFNVNATFLDSPPDDSCPAYDACVSACGTPPDPNDCVTVRDDPTTPENEYYVSPECDVIAAHRECMARCNDLLDDCITSHILHQQKSQEPVVEVENGYKGMVGDGITELYLKAIYPKGWKVINVECVIDQQIGNGEKGSIEIETETDQTTLLRFKPSAARPPFVETITIRFKHNDGKEYIHQQNIEVIKPPVILVHGIWADHSSMVELRTQLVYAEKYPPDRIYTFNYGPSSNQDIKKNVPLLAVKVDDMLTRLDNQGYKAKKVDLVAHSMGGLISRYYLEKYIASYDFMASASKVRKLITMNTPHEGSQVADWYTDYYENNLIDCAKVIGSQPPVHMVTNNEYDWLIKELKSNAKMVKPDALRFGPAVRQLQSVGRSGSIFNELHKKSILNKGVSYYFIAGTSPFLPWCQLTTGLAVREHIMPTYPYKCGGSLSPSKYGMKANMINLPIGPCGEQFGKTNYSDERYSPFEMTEGILSSMCGNDMDGVVTLQSQLYGTSAYIKPVATAVFEVNHFEVVSELPCIEQVSRYLFPDKMSGNYTAVVTRSPGYLRIADVNGNVLSQSHQKIQGGVIQEFEDVFGRHEYAFVPKKEGIKIEFIATEKGQVGIAVLKHGSTTDNYTSAKNIDVERGDKIVWKDHSDGSYFVRQISDGSEEKVNTYKNVINEDNDLIDDKIFTGRVVSEMSGEPLPDIVIKSDGTDDLDVTDQDGRFAVNVSHKNIYLYLYQGNKIIHGIDIRSQSSKDLGNVVVNPSQAYTKERKNDYNPFEASTWNEIKTYLPYALGVIAVFIVALFVVKGKDNRIASLEGEKHKSKAVEKKESTDEEWTSVQFCTNCGNPLVNNENYCGKCGHKIE